MTQAVKEKAKAVWPVHEIANVSDSSKQEHDNTPFLVLETTLHEMVQHAHFLQEMFFILGTTGEEMLEFSPSAIVGLSRDISSLAGYAEKAIEIFNTGCSCLQRSCREKA